jgi:hypothetical protein
MESAFADKKNCIGKIFINCGFSPSQFFIMMEKRKTPADTKSADVSRGAQIYTESRDLQ